MEGKAIKGREVSGTDESLSEAIAPGSVTTPELMGFNDWQVWRKTSGARPTNKKGDDRATTTKGEAELWQAILGELYGEDWTE